MLKMIIISLLLIGCAEDDDRLYIDRNCTDTEVSLIYEAVAKINAVAGDDYIEVGGLKRLKGDILNDSWHSIACLDSNAGLEPHTGETLDTDIMLYREHIANDAVFLHVVMHELVHYIAWGHGAEYHVDDDSCIMAEYVDTDPTVEFCGKDVEYIRSVL